MDMNNGYKSIVPCCGSMTKFAISISLQKDCIEETNNVPQQWKRSIHTSKDREVEQHQEKNKNRWRQN